mgnify:CR=1 FL=1
MFYRIGIQLMQAGAPSRYGPSSKCRLRPCTRALVGTAKDWTQASRMRDKALITELLLLLQCYRAVSNGLSIHMCVEFFWLYYPQQSAGACFQAYTAVVNQYNKYIILTTLFSKFSAITFIFFKSIAENFNRYLLILNVSVNM